jgi:predicted MPP superfamily phosphohydrolase
MAAPAIASIGLQQYGQRPETSYVSLERVTIPVKGLPPALHGFRIAQLSDMHIEPYTRPEVITAAVNITNQLQPHVIALTGDYVSYDAEAIHKLTVLLAPLQAKHGIFAIMGNHDLTADATFIHQALAQMGFQVLVNQGVALGQLYLAGVDDCGLGQPDLNAALAQHQPDMPVVLLAHEPDFADLFCQDKRVNLQLSGHTHGGQVRLPGFGAIILPTYGRKYQAGLYNVGGMWLYTNRGLGVMPIRQRINCPPEVTEFTLVAAV